MTSLIALAFVLDSVGLQPGDKVSPFEPYWISGPYAETRQCPVCEYGALPLVFVWSQFKKQEELKPVILGIEKAIATAPSGSQMAFLVDPNFDGQDKSSRKLLGELNTSWNTPHISYLSRVANAKQCLTDYKIATAEKWDTIIYITKSRTVFKTFLNPTEKDVSAIQEAIKSARD